MAPRSGQSGAVTPQPGYPNGVRLLGPLVNPLRPDAQVLGVARDDLLDPMAGALQQLGLRRAVVVHGAGGLDEASLAGPNQIRLIDSGSIRFRPLPEDLGLKTAPLDALRGESSTTASGSSLMFLLEQELKPSRMWWRSIRRWCCGLQPGGRSQSGARRAGRHGGW